MVIKADLSQEVFEQYVQECLQHLYDYSFLESHTLCRILMMHPAEGDQVEALRELLTQAIERLRPGTGVSFHSKAARSYNLLNLRYVLQQETQDVFEQMALSNRQFYREHSKAIHTLSRILWNHLDNHERMENKSLPTATISIESELQRSHEKATQTRVDLKNLLEMLIYDVQTLSIHRQIRVEFLGCDQHIILNVDRTLLRQAILWIASQLITVTTPGSKISLKAEVISGYNHLIFIVDDAVLNVSELQNGLTQQDTLGMFVKTLNAHVLYEQASQTVRVTLAIPTKQSIIMVIDDNPDLIELFKRYLAELSTSMIAAENGMDAIQLARKARPNLIILDIMLPGQDGLEILQNLKTHMSTREIPVLICSVLDAKGLALSLGASDFLRKPPSKADFLATLAHWRV